MLWTPFKWFYILIRLQCKLNEPDMSSFLIALYRCHVLLVIYISLPVLFSPVDHELGGDHQYLDDPTPYPAEEGKHSPTSLIPVLQIGRAHV